MTAKSTAFARYVIDYKAITYSVKSAGRDTFPALLADFFID
jgi:hypothetical protein